MACMGNKLRDVYGSGEVTPQRVYNFCRGGKIKILLLWLFRKAVLSALTRTRQCSLLGNECFPGFCSCRELQQEMSYNSLFTQHHRTVRV